MGNFDAGTRGSDPEALGCRQLPRFAAGDVGIFAEAIWVQTTGSEFARAHLAITVAATIEATPPERFQRGPCNGGTWKAPLKRIELPIGYGGPFLFSRAVAMPVAPQSAGSGLALPDLIGATVAARQAMPAHGLERGGMASFNLD